MNGYRRRRIKFQLIWNGIFVLLGANMQKSQLGGAHFPSEWKNKRIQKTHFIIIHPKLIYDVLNVYEHKYVW